jgi:thiamine-monophosphate kinase
MRTTGTPATGMKQTVSTAGEFGLIARIAGVLGAGAPQLEIGIGDDAAGWRQPDGLILASADMLVEGIHFDLALTGWRDLGWKALAVNLSDLAAMGARPSCALVCLALRPDADVEDVLDFYRGMRDLAGRSGCVIAGGDTVRARHEQVINVTVIGALPAAEAHTALRRDAGQPGDQVAVTGYLGASAAGLWLLQHASSAPGKARTTSGDALVEAHRRPRPQLLAGEIVRRAGVRCAMDISDGLLGDLGKICAAAGTGAVVRADQLPVHPAAVDAFPDLALEWAAAGGEDYELLFTAPPATMALAVDRLHTAGIRGTVIGELCATGGVRLVDAGGADVLLTLGGWDHFAAAGDGSTERQPSRAVNRDRGA